MRMIQCARNFDGVCERLVERHPAACQSRGKGVAVEVLHDEEVDLIVRADVVQRADVRMGKRGDCPRLAAQPRAHMLIERSTGREKLERHPAIEAGVTRAEHLTHPSRPDEPFDTVRPELHSWARSGSIIEQGRGSRPQRPIDNGVCCILLEQRFNFAP